MSRRLVMLSLQGKMAISTLFAWRCYNRDTDFLGNKNIYKLPIYNKLDTCLFLLFTCGYIPATAYALSPSEKLNKAFIVMIFSVVSVLLFYLVSLIIYSIIPLRVKEQMKTSIKQIYNREQPVAVEKDFIEAVDHSRYSQPTASTALLRQSINYARQHDGACH